MVLPRLEDPVREIILEKIKKRIKGHVPLSLDIEFAIDLVVDRMVIELRYDIAARKTVEWTEKTTVLPEIKEYRKEPATWWDLWKFEHRHWWLVKHLMSPPEYKEIPVFMQRIVKDVKAVYVPTNYKIDNFRTRLIYYKPDWVSVLGVHL